MRLYLSRPHMGGSEKTHVEDAFTSNFIAPVGPQLDEFENSVRQYLNEDLHCVAVSSGSAALHLALRIAGVGRDDEVWISSMTFAGGIFPLNYLGAIPRFFDLDTNSWTINTELLEEQLNIASKENRLPKAVVPTDLYGQSVDLDRLESLSDKFGFKLIVDSAESLGASFKKGRKAGSGGDASIISFNGNKIITTSGGGMFVTKHRHWAEQARFLATQARDPAPHYEHSTFGYNYRMSNICAAIGLGQMEILDDRVNRRRQIFFDYKTALEKTGIQFMPEPKGRFSTRWLTAITVDKDRVGVSREDIRKQLLEAQIESRPLWKPMHQQPLYKDFIYHGSGFDEGLFENGLCLPSGSDMTNEQQSEVIQIIHQTINR